MNKFLFILFLFIVLNSYSQQSKIDSLKFVLKNEVSNVKKVEVLESLNKLLIYSSVPDESIPYFTQMALLAKELNNFELETRAYKYISESFIRKEDFNNSEKYALKAIKINDSLNNINNYLLDINQLGRVYHHFQKYEKAIETYKKGINQYENDPQGKAICTIYPNLGTSYGQIGDTQNQISSYLKGAEYADKLKNYTAKSFALYNLGYIYMDLEQFDKAEKYFLNALKDSSKIELKAYVNMNHHSLGLNYSRWGKYDKALKHNKIALDFYRKSGNKLYEFDVLNNIAVVFNRKNQLNDVVIYANKALKIAKEINHQLAINGAKQTLASAYIDLGQFEQAEKHLLEISKDTVNLNLISRESKAAIYQNFASVYEGKKNYRKALIYFTRFKEVNDSILIDKRDSNVTEIETKYQTEKKEKENLQLKADNVQQELQLEKESKRKWYFGVGLLASLITLSVFIFYYKRNKEQKTVIENLQKDLHHRVKNNLAIIDALIDDIKDEFDNEKFKTKLTELQNRIDSINEVHSQLYKNTDVTNLQLKKYVGKLAKNVQQSFSKDNIVIKQHIDGSLQLKADKSFPVGLIINEFLTNSFKYAFDDNTKGVVSISIKEKAKTFILSLSDNGKGLPNNFDISKLDSFGIEVMKLLSKQLKGTFVLDGSKGVNLNIEFPKI